MYCTLTSNLWISVRRGEATSAWRGWDVVEGAMPFPGKKSFFVPKMISLGAF